MAHSGITGGPQRLEGIGPAGWGWRVGGWQGGEAGPGSPYWSKRSGLDPGGSEEPLRVSSRKVTRPDLHFRVMSRG